MTKIYVGNLPFSATEQDVRALFEAHGAVQSVALINDRDTGRPRGFGFVEMATADAQRAIQTLNGKDMAAAVVAAVPVAVVAVVAAVAGNPAASAAERRPRGAQAPRGFLYLESDAVTG